jgi:DNA invertase Pin-like site-specific DNA recombinase
MNLTKITAGHTGRKACVYLRQSTAGQLRLHRESTERQYQFQQRALQLGWNPERVEILDRDLGLSGTSMTEREDFKKLVAEVSLGRVGAVFALEASRLSRSCADWHRLLELCALTSSLIVDEDGVYDPTDFNDQLLLGLKGAMSQAELHFLRSRLWGGKVNKAAKGELRFPLPVGFCDDPQAGIVLDPDQQVQDVVRLFFRWFRETGSAYGVVRRFAVEDMKFPKRAYGGEWSGRLLWGPLEHGRALGLLRNPSYAGCYAFGRHRARKVASPDGRIAESTVRVPRDEWLVCVPDHHEGYITWERFLQNQTALECNRTNGEATVLPGPAREGHALLQGLLLCGTCGHRLTVRYQGNGGIRPTYECSRRRRDGRATASCVAFRCSIVDGPVSEKALEFVQPARLQIALRAIEELAERHAAVQRQWHLRIERARYEADLAQRRYEQVDPANRLVATTLEAQWNAALAALQTVQADHQKAGEAQTPAVTHQVRERIMALSADLPRIWSAAGTRTKERKEILRLLIKDITVERLPNSPRLVLHVRWQGGACEDIAVDCPPPVHEQVRHRPETVARTCTLARELHEDAQIAAVLNAEGHCGPKSGAFTTAMVRWLRYRHRIPAPCRRHPGELTVQETATRFGVSPGVVYYWIKRGIITARRTNGGSACWISIPADDQEQINVRAQKARKRSQAHQE